LFSSQKHLQIALIIKFPPPTVTAAQTEDSGKPAGHFDQALRSLMWNGDGGDGSSFSAGGSFGGAGAGAGFGGAGFAGFGAADRATGVTASSRWPPGLGPAPDEGPGYVPPSLNPGPVDGPGGSGDRV
jgi:hypothetical protein